ncbi:hypothetical protein GCM10028808_57370 [Spirosoma migulaei]
MNSAISLTFKDIFPNEEVQDIAYYIKGISKQKLIEVAVYLIYISDSSTSFRQEWKKLLFEYWFSSEERNIANDIYLRIKYLETIGIQGREEIKYKYVFLNQITALRFLEYIIRQTNTLLNDDGADLSTINLMLFKLILKLNTDFNETIDVKFEENDNFTKDYLTRMYVPISMAQYEVYTNNHFRLLYTYTMQQIKSLYLFEFLESSNPKLIDVFLEKYECQSVKEYNKYYITIIRAIFQRITNREVNKGFEASSFGYESSDEKSIKFTDKFLIDQAYTTDEEIDFKYLRTNPLVKYSNGQYAIISEVFAIQKLYNGLYFELKELYENDLGNQINTFRPYFTTYFSESFLLYKVLSFIYGKRSYVQFSGDEIKKTYLPEGGPDYYMRNGNKIFLFENKDNFITPSAKTSYNFDKIIEDIDKKLVTKGKGIPQIIKNIKLILKKNYPFDTSYQASKCKIYPLLITHRTEFDSSGLNRYLNERFQAELLKLKNDGYQINQIQPLTLINIDILLVCQFLLESKQIVLENLIDSYHQLMSSNRIHAYTNEDRDTKLHETYYSFSDYMLYTYAKKYNLNFKDELLKWTRFYFKDAIFG